MDWKRNKYASTIRIERFVAEYTLFSTQVFPYTKCKVRIWEQEDASFNGVVNIGVKDREKNSVDYTYGRGKTIEEALNNTISNLLTLIVDYETQFGHKLEDEDYEYSDPDDF